MKQFLIFFVMVFLIACSGTDLVSLESGDQTQLASETGSPHDDSIRQLASEGEIVKIGDKRLLELQVADTVGQNNLRARARSDSQTKTRVVVSLNSDKVITQASEGVSLAGTGQANADGEEIVPPALSFLVYMDNKKSCGAGQLRKYHQTFLSGIEAYDWQVGFAFYTDSGQLMPLEDRSDSLYNAGRMFKFVPQYLFNKREHAGKASDFFSETLRVYYDFSENQEESSKAYAYRFREAYSNKPRYPASNPLNGVSQILQNQFEGSLKKVVLWIGENLPYNTTPEWEEFFQNNPSASIFVISTRSAQVSSFMNSLESQHDVTYVPCQRSEELITGLVEQIVGRLN